MQIIISLVANFLLFVLVDGKKCKMTKFVFAMKT